MIMLFLFAPQELQSKLQEHQPSIDQLNEDARTMRRLVEHSRTNQQSHPDVEKLEKDVEALYQRWENVTTQVADR